MLSTVLSLLLIVMAIVLPLLVRKLFKKELFVILFILSPLFQVMLMAYGLTIGENIFIKHERFGYIVYYAILTIVTIELLLLMISPAIKSIKVVLQSNNDHFTKDIVLLILLVIALLSVPNVIFSFVYSFWAVEVVTKLGIGIWDAMYFCFSLSFSTPISGSFEELQNYINYFPILRLFQILHLLIVKVYEIVIVAVIVSKFMKVLERRLN